MKRTSLFCCFVLLLTNAMGQYNIKRNNVWAFGNHQGLDFNGGAPVAVSTGTYAWEGCASVCDTAGHLLFTTEGKHVWDRFGVLMPSGTLLQPFETISTTQAAVIVPVPGNIDQYYIFSLQNREDISTGDTLVSRLGYSVVDMSLNGGLGAVVGSGKFLRGKLSEKMTAVPGTNCNIWLIVHNYIDSTANMPSFYAYNITAAGIDTTPVVSLGGAFSGYYSYMYGVMKASPDGTRLAVANFWSWGTNGCELFDFDATTGMITGRRLVDTLAQTMGLAFSPDGKKLYSANTSVGTLYQYDLTAPSIPSSRYLVAAHSPTAAFSDLSLGPDGKIYLASFTSNLHLARISSPNVAGASCSYYADAISVPPTPGTYGMPNVVVDPHFPLSGATASISVQGTHDTTLGSTVTLTATVAASGSYMIVWRNHGVPFDTTTTPAVTYIKSAGTDTITAQLFSASSSCYYPVSSGAHFVTEKPAGITDRPLATCRLYPSPTTGTLLLEGASGSTLELTDMLGRKAFQATATTDHETLQVSAVPAGLYMVRITSQDGTQIHTAIEKQ